MGVPPIAPTARNIRLRVARCRRRDELNATDRGAHRRCGNVTFAIEKPYKRVTIRPDHNTNAPALQ